jgi:hypothetical protein
MNGEVSEWPVLGGLGKQLGDWVDQFVGAQQIANIITEAFPIEGQPAAPYRPQGPILPDGNQGLMTVPGTSRAKPRGSA